MSDSSQALFICSELHRGGAERQWAHLLPALRERGLDVRLLALRDTGPFFDQIADSGVPATCVHMRSRHDLPAFRRALQWAARPDVVVSQGVNALVVAQAIAVARHRPHVAIDHTPPGLPRSAHRRLLTRLLAHRTERLVAVSRTQIPDLNRLGYRNVEVIYNAVPALEPSRPREESRAALGLGVKDVAVMLVAKLRQQKNVPLFIEALGLAHLREPLIRGFVVGGGPLLAEVQALAGIGGPTRIMGERDDVADLLDAADIVSLSSNTEALPMVLLEAMALARPTVVTDVGGNTEVVVDRVTGLVVPPGDARRLADAFVELAGNGELRETLGTQGKARQRETFGFRRMVDEYEALLMRAAKRPNQ